MARKPNDEAGEQQPRGVDSLSHIRNKLIRSRLQSRQRREKRREKATRRRRRHLDESQGRVSISDRKVPLTIEDKREYDSETGVAMDEDAKAGIVDEFSCVLDGEVMPRVIVTTSMHATGVSFGFCRELLGVIPDSIYYERGGNSIGEVLDWAREKGVTDVLIVKEDRRELTEMMHGHLPQGPTALYKLSSFVRGKDVPGHGRATRHTPEVTCSKFSTELGVRTGRMLASLFPHRPDFTGRQIVTFHNQRDFIFFRYHRYVFNAKKQGARLQELGPRFTLKLRAIQAGLFHHPDTAKYEWKWRAKSEVNRRKFFL